MCDYVTTAEADAYAANHLSGASWSAATSAQKAAAIAQATLELDAQRYGGRKYDTTQQNEFPRILGALGGVPVYPGSATVEADVIWDWDAATNAAIVPPNVKRACFEQALSLIADPTRSGRLAAQADGVIAQSAGGVSESYRPDAKAPPLCRMATQLLAHYRLRTGRIT